MKSEDITIDAFQKLFFKGNNSIIKMFDAFNFSHNLL